MLHLGNIAIASGEDGKSVLGADDGALKTVAELINVDAEKLRVALTTRDMTVRGDTTVIPLNEVGRNNYCFCGSFRSVMK